MYLCRGQFVNDTQFSKNHGQFFTKHSVLCDCFLTTFICVLKKMHYNIAKKSPPMTIYTDRG